MALQRDEMGNLRSILDAGMNIHVLLPAFWAAFLDAPRHTIANLCWAFAKSKNSNKDLFDMPLA